MGTNVVDWSPPLPVLRPYRVGTQSPHPGLVAKLRETREKRLHDHLSRVLRSVGHIVLMPFDGAGRRATGVLDSLVRHDVNMASAVWARDERIDRLCAQLSRELIGRMTENPGALTLGIDLLFCTKNLERIGDHATNIAEAIYYIVEGRRLSGERPKADVTRIVPD